MISRAFSIVALLALMGCVREVSPPAYVPPGPYGAWAKGDSRHPASRPVWPSQQLVTPHPHRLARRGARVQSEIRPDVPPSPVLRPAASSSLPRAALVRDAGSIPGGLLCLAELDRRGVPHEVLDETRGVDTPVAIRVPLGGVKYHTWGDAPLVGDCRLMVVLLEIGPELRAAGVTQARFSGAYVYRTTRSGSRLSLHAHGLAIDIHDMMIDGKLYSVKRDFARGRPATKHCAKLPPVNRVACQVGERGLFKELLTPDSDRDHHDHFHFGVAPFEL